MNKLFYSIYLLIVFLSIWGPIPNNIGGIIIVLFFLLWFCFDKNFIFLSPALTIPFIFVLKSKSLESLVIAGLTDILMILAITYYFLININSFSSINKKNVSIPVFLILLHIIYTTLNGVYYMEGITMFFVFIRTYILPLLYLLVLVLVSKNNSRIPLNGLQFFVISLFIVQCISIFQYYDFIKLPSENAVLAKHVARFIEGGFNLNSQTTVPEREVMGLFIPRLNMLIGGSVGSSASIVFALGLLSLFSISSKNYFNNVIKIIFSIVFLFAALLTISTSILISILIFSFFYLKYRNLSYYTILIVFIVPIFFIISTSALISIDGDLRLLDYIISIYFGKTNFIDIGWILGKGPILFSSGFELRPENYMIDVGIFRVMQESGIINMLILLAFIYKVISITIYDFKLNKSKLIILFSVLFILTLSSVHTNFMIYPPFNILFAICTAWLLSKDKKKSIQII
jgi:hypothetical protein